MHNWYVAQDKGIFYVFNNNRIVILISLNIKYRDINVTYINYDKINITIRFTNN